MVGFTKEAVFVSNVLKVIFIAIVIAICFIAAKSGSETETVKDTNIEITQEVNN